MGEELSMARAETQRWSMLLASTGEGESGKESGNRNQRSEEPNTSKRGQRGKAKDTTPKSKGSSKAKGTDASSSKSARRGRDNKNRKQDRGDEGEDKASWRTAQELGITFPGSYCNETQAHHWVEVEKVASGSLFQCQLCKKHLWLSLVTSSAIEMGSLIKEYGKDEWYCRFLNCHRQAKILMAKMQDLARLELEVMDKRKLAKEVDRIMRDKEYDRK